MSKIPSPYEIVVLFGLARGFLPKKPELNDLFQNVWKAIWLKEKWEKRQALQEMVEKAKQGDAQAKTAVESVGFDWRLVDDLQDEIAVLARMTATLTKAIADQWIKVGPALEEAVGKARQRRWQAFGGEAQKQTPPFTPSGPTLEEVASQLREKKDLLLLLQTAVAGDQEARSELKRRGLGGEAWQTTEWQEQLKVVSKQVRILESRFSALRVAQAEKEAQAQQEIREQIAGVQQQRRQVEAEITFLEKSQEKLSRQGPERTVLWKELQAQGLVAPTALDFSSAVKEAISQRRQALSNLDRNLQRLAERSPEVGQKVQTRLAGVPEEEVPRLAALKDLVDLPFDSAVIEKLSATEQWLAIGEARWRLAEEALYLEGYLRNDEGSKEYWQAKGAPEVWGRRDAEEALRRRQELLAPLTTKSLELEETLELRAQELLGKVFELQSLVVDDGKLLATYPSLPVAEAREQVEAAKASLEQELAVIWAAKRQQEKLAKIYGS